MRLVTNAFTNDYLTISRWELIRLFFGATIKCSALIVSCRRVGRKNIK